MALNASDFEELKQDDFVAIADEPGLNESDFEALNESDFEPIGEAAPVAEEEPGLIDKAVSLFSLSPEAQADQDRRDAHRERVAKRNDRGILREGTNKILFGSGEEYENPTSKVDYNPGKKAINRSNELLASGAAGLGRWIDEGSQLLGGEANGEIKKGLYSLANWIKKDKLPTDDVHNTESVKEAFAKGGLFDIDTIQQALNFSGESGVQSAADMAHMTLNLPFYMVERGQEFADQRMEEKGLKGQEPTNEDMLIGLGGGVVSGILEKVGLKATTGDIVEALSKQFVGKTYKEAVKAIAKEVAKGTLKEAGTELVQEGFIEPATERIGTGSKKDLLDIERGLFGALAGGVAGGTISTTVGIGTEAYRNTAAGKKAGLEQAAATIIDSTDLEAAPTHKLFSMMPGTVIDEDEKRVIIDATKDTIAEITPEEAAEVIQEVTALAEEAEPEQIEEVAAIVEEIAAGLTPEEETELAALLDLPDGELDIDSQWRMEDLQAKQEGEAAPGELIAEDFEEISEETPNVTENMDVKPITQKEEIELSPPVQPEMNIADRKKRLTEAKKHPRLTELVDYIEAAREYEKNRGTKGSASDKRIELEARGLDKSQDEYKAEMVKWRDTPREASPLDVFSNYSAAELRELKKGKVSSAMLEKVEGSLGELELNPEFNTQTEPNLSLNEAQTEPKLNPIQAIREKRNAEAAFGEVAATPTTSIKPKLFEKAAAPVNTEPHSNNYETITMYQTGKQGKYAMTSPTSKDGATPVTMENVNLWHTNRRNIPTTSLNGFKQRIGDMYDGVAIMDDNGNVEEYMIFSTKKLKKGETDGRENTTAANENGSEELIGDGTGNIDTAGQPGTEERTTDTAATQPATIIGESRNDDTTSDDTTWEKQHYIKSTPYSVEDINHETPSVVVAKLIKRDISKFVDELKKASGLISKPGKTFNGVDVNLPPAGGEATFTLWDRNFKYGARFDIKIEPDYNAENGYDDYAMSYTIPIELVTDENKKIRGIGYMHFGINKYRPDEQPYSTKEIAAEIKEFVDNAQGEVDHHIKIDAMIEEAKNAGKPKHQPFGELDMTDIVPAKAVHGKPDLVVQDQIGQWVELPGPAQGKYGKYGRITGKYDMDYNHIEVEISKAPDGSKTASVPTFTVSRVALINTTTERKVRMFLHKLGYEEVKEAAPVKEKAPVAKKSNIDSFEGNEYYAADYKAAQEQMSIEKQIIPGTQGSLFGQTQMDIRESQEYIVPRWAKPLVSDTVRYDDIIKAINAGARRNNAVPSELGNKVIKTMLSHDIITKSHKQVVEERLKAEEEQKSLLAPDPQEAADEEFIGVETATDRQAPYPEYDKIIEVHLNIDKQYPEHISVRFYAGFNKKFSSIEHLRNWTKEMKKPYRKHGKEIYYTVETTIANNKFWAKENKRIKKEMGEEWERAPISVQDKYNFTNMLTPAERADTLEWVNGEDKYFDYATDSDLVLVRKKSTILKEALNETDTRDDGTNTVRTDDRGAVPENGSATSENASQPDDIGNESDTTREPDGAGVSIGEGSDREQSPEIEEDNVFILEQQTAVASGEISRFNDNIAAIKLLKEKKQRYTLEEKKILSRYTGWGGLQKAFRNPKGDYAKGWEERANRLSKFLTEEEHSQARSGVLDAYYTPVETVRAMWKISEHLGFNGGTVLEPSMGTGRFFGLVPEKYKSNTAFNGVELDPTTYKIATALYKVNGRNKGFQETEYKEEHELVVGNPPYAKQIKIVDKNNKKLSGLTIHDYFVAKSLDALKDGGVLNFVITSSFMDSMTNKAKAEINKRAKLIGAIRLPNNVFASAGTKVTTDIVIFQKLQGNEKGNLAEWGTVTELNGAKINKYFETNPSMLLGEWKKGYRGGELISTPGPIDLKISEAMQQLPKNIMNKSATITKQDDVTGADTQVPASVIYKNDGAYYVNIKTGESLQPQLIKGKAERVESFIKVRDLANSVIDMQLDTTISESVLEAERANLNAAYDSFFKKHGYLNNSTNRSIIVQDKSGYTVLGLEEKYQRKVSPKQAFTWGVSEQAESGQKADILTKRTIKPLADVKTTDSNEALLLSVYRKGGVDFNYIKQITGKTKDTLVKELKGKIFKDERGGYVTKDVFLSGDVKTKLEYTVDEAARKALEKVIPVDKEAHEITADIGSSWISTDIHKQYMKEKLGFNQPSIGFNRTTGKWSVPTSNHSYDFPFSAAADDVNVLASALNNKKIIIRRKEKVGNVTKSFVDEEATTLVNAKVEELREDFANWIFKDEKRRNELVPLYNDLYNRYNKVEIEDKVTEYEIPNLKFFKPREHQTKAVYKAVFGNNPLLLNHTVGSGKTLTSQMIAMEWRRLGKANKPLIVALKSTVEQFTREFKEAYPSAKVLLPTDSDFKKENRKRFLSSIATGDYDSIVLSHEQLQKLENPYELQKQLIEDEIEAAKEALLDAQEDNDRFTVRDLETAIEKLEARFEKLTDSDKDQDILSFEKLGIDGMIVDESHQFKKLTYSTSMGSIKGMPSTDGSIRAFDLFVKTKAILQKNNNLVFMTGTPVTNTLPELFLIQKYLQEDVLQDQGLAQFDSWAKNYADPTTDIEMTPTGGFKEVTRMKSFKNIPMLMETAGLIIDTVTNEEIKKSDPNFKLPELNGGKPQTIFIEPSEAQLDFTKTLIKRLEKVNQKENPDNHLAIFGDAVKMSMDMRLLGDYADEATSKVNEVISKAMDKYNEFTKEKGTQLIFSDIGTPKGGGKAKATLEELMAKAEAGNEEAQKQIIDDYSDAEIEDILYGGTFSIYEDIRSKLISQGVPAKEIAFIHDYGTKTKKDELSTKVNNGEIRFVLGSTKKLGTGMNVQKKLTAVHHIDIPYTPAELEQRNGRIIRQGNTLLAADPDFRADVFYYATKQTLDGVKWQILENKAKFIQDFMSGVSSDVDIEEESNSELAERMKAEASGNPYLIDKIKADKRVKKLEALKRGFETNQAGQRSKLQREEYAVSVLPGEIANITKDIDQIDTNEVKINGKSFEKPGKMGEAVYKILDSYVQAKGLRPKDIGKVGNITISISHDQDNGYSKIIFDGERNTNIAIEFFKQDPAAIGMRINNHLQRYKRTKTELESELVDSKKSIVGINKKLDEKFNKWEEYKAAKAEQQEAIENIEAVSRGEEVKPKTKTKEAAPARPGQTTTTRGQLQEEREQALDFFDEVEDNGLVNGEKYFIKPFIKKLRGESKIIDNFVGNKEIDTLFKFGEKYSYLPGSHKIEIGQVNVSIRDMVIAIEHEIAHFKTIGYIAENPTDPRVKYIEQTVAYMKKHETDILSKLDGNSKKRVKYILSRTDGIIRTAEAIAVIGSEKLVALDLYSVLGKEKPRLSDIIAQLVRNIKKFVVGKKTVTALDKKNVSAANLAAGIKELINEGAAFNEADGKTAREARAAAREQMPEKNKERSRFDLNDDMRPAFVHLGDFANLPFALTEMLNKGKNKFDRGISAAVTSKIKGTKLDNFMRKYIGASQAGLGLLSRSQEKDFVKHFRVLQARLSKADISAEDKAKLIEDAQGDIHDDLFNAMAIDYLENPEARAEIEIDFPELAAELDKVRDYINRLSEEAMQRGIILPSQHSLWQDRYLSRLYLSTQKPEVAAKMQSGIKGYEQKSGRKIDSIIQYLMENPQEQERLGAVLDVDLMIKQTIAKTQGNIGIDEFFRGITERSHIADTDILVALGERVNNLPMMFSPHYATEVAIPYIEDMIRRLDENLDDVEIYELEERLLEIQDQIPGALDAASYLEIDKDKAAIPKDKRYGPISGLMLPKDVASLVQSQFVAGIDPQTIVEQADSAGRKLLTYFKWAKVPANIFAYPRNLQSNFWQWAMSGADPVHFFKEYPLAIKSMITKDKWYDLARENGILNTNAISAEVNDSLRIIGEEMAADRLKSKALIKAMSVVGDAYGVVDDIAKIARMKYGMQNEGKSAIDAVSTAQDTHYDYSLTYDLIRGMRDPDMTRGMMLKLVGTLFPTYTQKTIAFLYESMIERPASMLLIAAGLAALIRGGEDDEREKIGSKKYDEILKTLPEWTENNPLIKVSMENQEDGSIEVTMTDISYVIPFGSLLAAASSAVHGDLPGAAGNLGVGGSPFQMISALKNNIDSFTGREIYYEHDAWEATKDGAKYLGTQFAPGTITKVLSLMDTKHPVPIRLAGINSYVYDSRELEKYNEYAAKEALMDAGKRATRFKRKIYQADKDLRKGKITREEHQAIVTRNEEEVNRWKDLGQEIYNEKSVLSAEFKDYNTEAKKIKGAVKEYRTALKESKKENGDNEPLKRFKADREKLGLLKKYETVKSVEREVRKLKKVKEMINGKNMTETAKTAALKKIEDRMNVFYERGFKRIK